MSYTTIIFNANDAWGFDICSFKVNLVAKELSIYYRNNKGGYTSSGINLTENEAKHINYVASPKIFENFRDGKWREKMEVVWILDGIEWEMQFISNDGRPILEIKSDMKPFLPPPSLVTLVNYVLKIGLPKDYKLNLFTEGE